MLFVNRFGGGLFGKRPMTRKSLGCFVLEGLRGIDQSPRTRSMSKMAILSQQEKTSSARTNQALFREWFGCRRRS
jgi:hypothetical protein